LGVFTISFNEYNISLDRREQGSNLDFISHAHTDHITAAKKSQKVLSSVETAELIESAYGISVNRFEPNEKGIKLLDSGHMFGSKQLYIEDYENGKSIIYTGDFQMQESDISKPIEIKQADIAIIDSTYSNPKVRFPNRQEIIENIILWVTNKISNGIILFSAYRMGKAQELIKIMNKAGIKPVVTKKISEVNKVYEKNGISLAYSSAYNSDLESDGINDHNFVGITEDRNVRMLAEKLGGVYKRRVYTAVATGFAEIFRFNTDVQFPLSDHADFYQILEYISKVQPKKIYTYGKSKEFLAKSLAESGYDALPSIY